MLQQIITNATTTNWNENVNPAFLKMLASGFNDF